MADGPTDRPDEPDEPDSPFAGMPFFLGGFDPSQLDLNAVMRLMQSPGPVNWEVARQVASSVAVTTRRAGSACSSSAASPPSPRAIPTPSPVDPS